MKTILVTGGAGFIGSHVAERAIEIGHKVIVIDNLTTGSREYIPPEATFLEGDILELNISEIVEKYRVTDICHLAAKVSVRKSTSAFVEDAKVNFIGSLRLVEAALNAKINSFVYASTMAVYSDSQKPTPIDENYSTSPLSPYGVAKLATERDIKILLSGSKTRPVILRYFNTYGPRQKLTPYVGVINIFASALKKKHPITVFGSGHQRRDFVYVTDVAAATVNAIENPNATGTYNVGTSLGFSVNEIADLLMRRYKTPKGHLKYAPVVCEELTNSIANNKRAQKDLQFQISMKLPKYLQDNM